MTVATPAFLKGSPMPRLILSLAVLPACLLLPPCAAAQAPPDTIASRAKADQAACRKEPAGAQAACLRQAKEKEQQARAEANAQRQEKAPGRNMSGRGTVGAGQYGHVAPNGNVTIGGRKDMPQSTIQAQQQAEDLRRAKLPSNQPVDVTRAAREVQAGQARPKP
jgi:hypothetical protein